MGSKGALLGSILGGIGGAFVGQPAAGAAIGGGIGGMIGGKGSSDADASVASAMQANEMNILLARENRDWMEKMSNTAHVREVQDLKNAGLNPILSAMGTGASTPHSAAAVVQNPKAKLAADRATIQNVITNTAKIVSDIYLNKQLGEKARSETRMQAEELGIIKANRRIAEQQAEMETSPYGRAMNWVRMTLSSGLGNLVGGAGILGAATRILMSKNAKEASGRSYETHNYNPRITYDYRKGGNN